MFALGHELLIDASFDKFAGRFRLRQLEKLFEGEARSEGNGHCSRAKILG